MDPLGPHVWAAFPHWFSGLPHLLDLFQPVLLVNFNNLARSIGQAVFDAMFYGYKILVQLVLTGVLWYIEPLLLNTPAVTEPIIPYEAHAAGQDGGIPSYNSHLTTVIKTFHDRSLVLAFSGMSLGLVISFFMLGLGFIPNWREAAKENLKRLVVFSVLASFSLYFFQAMIDLNTLMVHAVMTEGDYESLLGKMLNSLMRGSDAFALAAGLTVALVCVLVVLLELAARYGILIFIPAVGPLVIMGYAFNFTRGFSNKAMKTFLAANFLQFFAAVGVRLMLETIVAFRAMENLPSWALLAGMSATIAVLPKLLSDAGGAIGAMTKQITAAQRVAVSGAAMTTGAGAALGLRYFGGAAQGFGAAAKGGRIASGANRLGHLLQDGGNFSARVSQAGAKQTRNQVLEAAGAGGLTKLPSDDLAHYMKQPRPMGTAGRSPGAPPPGGPPAPGPSLRGRGPHDPRAPAVSSEPTAVRSREEDLSSTLDASRPLTDRPAANFDRAERSGFRHGAGLNRIFRGRAPNPRPAPAVVDAPARQAHRALLASTQSYSAKRSDLVRLTDDQSAEGRELGKRMATLSGPQESLWRVQSLRPFQERLHEARTPENLVAAHNEAMGEIERPARAKAFSSRAHANWSHEFSAQHGHPPSPQEQEQWIQAQLDRNPRVTQQRSLVQNAFNDLAQARGFQTYRPAVDNPARLSALPGAPFEYAPERAEANRQIGLAAASIGLAAPYFGRPPEESRASRQGLLDVARDDYASDLIDSYARGDASLDVTQHLLNDRRLKATSDLERAAAQRAGERLQNADQEIHAAAPPPTILAMPSLDEYKRLVTARDLPRLEAFHDRLRDHGVDLVATQLRAKDRSLSEAASRDAAQKQPEAIQRALEPTHRTLDAIDAAGGLRRGSNGRMMVTGDAPLPLAREQMVEHQLATLAAARETDKALAPAAGERQNEVAQRRRDDLQRDHDTPPAVGRTRTWKGRRPPPTNG